MPPIPINGRPTITFTFTLGATLSIHSIFASWMGVAIERHVPTIPLIHDEQRYEDLRRSLAVYRMVIGQPRQEDLLTYLVDRVSPERLDELRLLLQIDMKPVATTGSE